ncbi:MAG: FxsA family protein [Immundisolibacter sp.]|uniref:FxsA family protein n=1 Tax=Immundisolibacter sp. TaxID=1934948 RepID=UPI003EE37008
MPRFLIWGALLGLPLLELYVLLEVGSRIGALPTLLLLIAAAFIGTALMRRAGLTGLLRVRAALEAGELPARPLLEATLTLIAGGLFVVPGFLTDIFGLFLLLPPLRRRLAVYLIDRQPQKAGGSGRVIEGEYHRDDHDS